MTEQQGTPEPSEQRPGPSRRIPRGRSETPLGHLHDGGPEQP